MPSAARWVAVLVLAVPVASTADDLEDFRLARNAYDTGDYELATERFRELLDREPPPSLAIRVDCLQYSAAAYLFLGQAAAADDAFEWLLVLEPEWEMDAAVFPTPILDEFARVKAAMRERLAAMREGQERLAELERLRRAEEERTRRAALAAALEPRYLAREHEDRSLFLAFVPFGVGQFQNGQDAKGWTFFGIETALFAANAWTFLAWDWYTRKWNEALHNDLPTRQEQAASFARGYKIASWSVLGSLLAVMLAGIIDALVFFEDSTTEWHLLPVEEVPPEQRLPVRDPDEFLGPRDPNAADPGGPPATSLLLTFPL